MDEVEDKLLDKMLDSLGRIMDLIGRTEEEALYKSNFSDLSRTELHTLLAIGLYEVKTMTELADAVSVTAGTLTVQIDKLVRKGYVEKRKRPSDKRVSEIKLSRKGKIAVRVRRRFNSLLLNYLLQPLSAEQEVFLAQTLSKVEDYLYEKYREYKQREM